MEAGEFNQGQSGLHEASSKQNNKKMEKNPFNYAFLDTHYPGVGVWVSQGLL